jgi:hypothetical protein
VKSEKKEPKQKEEWRKFRAEDGTEMFMITRTGRSTIFTLIAVRVEDFHSNLRYRLPGATNSTTFNLDDDYSQEDHNGEKYYLKVISE